MRRSRILILPLLRAVAACWGTDLVGGRRGDAQRCLQGCAPEGLAIKYRVKYL
jgi:hypothetical protein